MSLGVFPLALGNFCCLQLAHSAATRVRSRRVRRRSRLRLRPADWKQFVQLICVSHERAHVTRSLVGRTAGERSPGRLMGGLEWPTRRQTSVVCLFHIIK